MTPLTLVLLAKIGVTLLFVVVPLLIASSSRLEKSFGVTALSPTLFRLYGVAVLALLVGYASGFFYIAHVEFPWGVTTMGLVSNAGAVIALIMTGAWRANVPLGSFFAVIALALMVAMLMPELAISRL